MLTYLARKLLQAIPTVLGVALIVFVLFNVIGGDPAMQMAGKHATARQLHEIRAHYGLDKPKPVQFLMYLKEIATFDYGKSFATKQPINEMILDGIGPSLTLTVPAFLLTTLISIALALLVAYYRGRWIDKMAVVACVFGMSLSMLAYILFGQYVLAYHLGWFPISGWDWGWPDRLGYVAMPVLIWVVVSLGYEVRFFRTAILDEAGQDYVRTARAKGLPESRVFFKHVLKNSMVPIVTNVMVELPLLILGAFLLENFFGIPGLGSITINAIGNSDLPVIKAMTTLLSLLVIATNITTDVIYTLVDPRVRLT